MLTKISIIVPVYNEEKTVISLLDKVFRLKLKNYRKEIIVVDDGSRDSTSLKLKKYAKKLILLRHKINKGKGSAIRTALQKVTGDLVVIQDADLELDPKQIAKLLDKYEKNKGCCVLGYRKLIGKNKTVPFYYSGAIFLTKVVNMLFNTKLKDVYTCYKLCRTQDLKRLKLTSNRFEIEAEIVVKLLKRGLPIREVAVTYTPRKMQEGKKIRPKDGILGLITIFKYGLWG